MINALIGGVLIGVAVSLMLALNGRITGISGILGSLLPPAHGDRAWRLMFLLGLLAGGAVLNAFYAPAFEQSSSAYLIDYAVAGVFVGFGTLLGGGCTSGHGVCGISRLSMRSILATGTFIFFGILSLLVFKFLRGSI